MADEFVAESLGWGVQSWTMAAMSALGVLPKLDAAVHANTTHEREGTYAFARQWTPWLEQRGIRVVTTVNRDSRKTLVVVGNNEVTIPGYTINGDDKGQIRRQCTDKWKIAPIKRVLQFLRNGSPVTLWIGITKDEWQRAKPSSVKYITHVFPLLEMGFTRQDCLDWLEAHDLPSPGKSSCVFCPFLNKKAWEDMRAAGGADWEKAIQIDLQIRNIRLPGELFVNNKRVPLEQAVTISSQKVSSEIEMLVSDDDDAECDSGHCFL